MAKTQTTTMETPPEPQAAPAAPVIEIGSKEFHGLPSEVRTQMIADARYKGSKRWFCQHAGQPSITLSADSAPEAEHRFKELCGIISHERPIGVEPV